MECSNKFDTLFYCGFLKRELETNKYNTKASSSMNKGYGVWK